MHIVDDMTGRGVPCVRLTAVSSATYFTDSNGVAVFEAPGVAAAGGGTTYYLHVAADGLSMPADWAGYRGFGADAAPGSLTVLRVNRTTLAERVYRLTGEGIYRDSALAQAAGIAGVPAPRIAQPFLNAQVSGQDSVLNAVYKGRLMWFWGDTLRPSYPLGNFATTGAWSNLTGGLPASQGVDLHYYAGVDGFVRHMTAIPGAGPTWVSSVVTLPAPARGGEHVAAGGGGGGGPAAPQAETLWARYSKVHGDMSTYRWGLLRWNDTSLAFDEAAMWPMDAPIRDAYGGHAFVYTGDPGTPEYVSGPDRQAAPGTAGAAASAGAGAAQPPYVYIGDPFPVLRVPATAEALADLAQYESWTPLLPGATVDPDDAAAAALDRTGPGGALRYAWRKGSRPLSADDVAQLLSARAVNWNELSVRVRDATNRTCSRVYLHGGSLHYNAYRRKWVAIATQGWGSLDNDSDDGMDDATASNLGEVWYSEAGAPEGPWVYAVKVATHAVTQMSFYNPTQHVQLDEAGGRVIYFSGTLAQTFSSAPAPLPRYDYNNMVYRLDLSTVPTLPPLGLEPCPAYTSSGGGGGWQGPVLAAAVVAGFAGITLFIACVVRRRKPAPGGARRVLYRDSSIAFHDLSVSSEYDGSHAGLGRAASLRSTQTEDAYAADPTRAGL